MVVHLFDPGDVQPVRRRDRVRIWNNTPAVIVEALASAGLPPRDLASVGIANFTKG
jgi:hypothetical protein